MLVGFLGPKFVHMMQSYYFGNSRSHEKFKNPSRTHSGRRKVTTAEKRMEKMPLMFGNTFYLQHPRAVHALARTNKRKSMGGPSPKKKQKVNQKWVDQSQQHKQINIQIIKNFHI